LTDAEQPPFSLFPVYFIGLLGLDKSLQLLERQIIIPISIEDAIAQRAFRASEA
jgi:hypothetical protein